MTSTPPDPKVRLVEISADMAEQRIDNFLARELRGVPKSLIYRILRRGEVRVNRGRVKPGYRIRAGDQVRIPPVRVKAPTAGSPPDFVIRRLEERPLYEDSTLLVVNKPAGIPVHAGTGVKWGVIESLRILRPDLQRLELVHRLDRETSGCLLLAKSAGVLRDLHRAFREREVDKRYLALVLGDWQGGHRQVRVPLRRGAKRGGERLVVVSEDGQQAETAFTPLTHYRGATLVEARPGTGRTHQIRVHAAHLGHPLAADDRYGERGFNRRVAALGLRRLFLHAHYLGIPTAQGDRVVDAPLPADLRAVLDAMESN